MAQACLHSVFTSKPRSPPPSTSRWLSLGFGWAQGPGPRPLNLLRFAMLFSVFCFFHRLTCHLARVLHLVLGSCLARVLRKLGSCVPRPIADRSALVALALDIWLWVFGLRADMPSAWRALGSQAEFTPLDKRFPAGPSRQGAASQRVIVVSVV